MEVSINHVFRSVKDDERDKIACFSCQHCYSADCVNCDLECCKHCRSDFILCDLNKTFRQGCIFYEKQKQMEVA